MGGFWKLGSRDLYSLRGGGGDPFTRFVESIVRAQAYSVGIPSADVVGNLRSNIPDGGVDTEVRSGKTSDSSGWLREPTIWQHKRTEYKNLDQSKLREDIRKRYASDRICAGYAYRLTICDDLTPEEVTEAEEWLLDEARKLRLDPAMPRVITATALADWASRFPALVLQLRPSPGASSLTAWAKSARSVTRTYVPVPDWGPMAARIVDHADLSVSCVDVVLPVFGQPGVGKTRLVVEALAARPALDELVLYTIHDNLALELAHGLANDEGLEAILVADESSVNLRHQLAQLLQGHGTRIRVIAIDNQSSAISGPGPEIALPQISSSLVERILAENYPEVPDERRRAYVQLAGGFVGFAADLCRHNAEIPLDARVDHTTAYVRSYLKKTLSHDEWNSVAATSLLLKVGFEGDVSNEATALCSLLDLDLRSFVRAASRLKNAARFIAKGGRYFYVTPELVAAAAFSDAWGQWIAQNPTEFMARIPNEILRSFLERVSRSGREEVRRVVGDFFRDRFLSIPPRALADTDAFAVVETLVETDPVRYLPILRRLVESAQPSELGGDGRQRGRFSPRRRLVWLAERMLGLPDFYYDAEAILYRLAQVESEPDIANNATRVWQASFRSVLSGTPVPFADRLAVLEQRLRAADTTLGALCIGAFDAILDRHASRTLGPAVIAGRIPPPEWRPRTVGEDIECQRSALLVLGDIVVRSDPAVRDGVRRVIVKHLRNLLTEGLLAEVQQALALTTVPEEELPTLLDVANDYLVWDAARSGASESYVESVRMWLTAFTPSDFRGTLISTVGSGVWSRRVRAGDAAWRAALKDLAAAVCANPVLLAESLDWLFSERAKSAYAFGEELGKADPAGQLITIVLPAAARPGAYPALARGYVHAAAVSHPPLLSSLNSAIDAVVGQNPAAGYALFTALPNASSALPKLLALIDAKALTIEYLRGFILGVGVTSLPPTDWHAVMSRLRSAVDADDDRALDVAVDLLFQLWHGSPNLMLDDPGLLTHTWRILDAAGLRGKGEASFWGDVIEALAERFPEQAAQVASHALTSDDFLYSQRAEQTLAVLAARHPATVMDCVGQAAMDQETGWRFDIGVHRAVIEALPPDTVISWIQRRGVEGARRLARHLPRFSLDATGKPVIPRLTEFVLRSFEADDQTFNAFCAGYHSFEMMMGDIAAKKQGDAEGARPFLAHPIRRVREWAEHEVRDAQHEAGEWRRMREESDI